VLNEIKNKKTGPKPATKEDVEQWLNDKFPKFKLIEYGGSPTSISKFLDINRNIEFQYRFDRLKAKLNQNINHLFSASKEEIVKKIGDTLEIKTGKRHALQVEKYKTKQESTIKKNLNVKNAFCSEKVKEKIKITNLEKYNVENPSQNKEIQKKIKHTMLLKYGCEFPMQNEEISKIIIEKSNNKKINKGLIKVIKGKTRQEWAKKLDVSYSLVKLRANNFRKNRYRK
jgi:hypothetical protein